jgi:hypothetical protein
MLTQSPRSIFNIPDFLQRDIIRDEDGVSAVAELYGLSAARLLVVLEGVRVLVLIGQEPAEHLQLVKMQLGELTAELQKHGSSVHRMETRVAECYRICLAMARSHREARASRYKRWVLLFSSAMVVLLACVLAMVWPHRHKPSVFRGWLGGHC